MSLGLSFLTSTRLAGVEAGVINTGPPWLGSDTSESDQKGLWAGGGERQHNSPVPLRARVILDLWMKAKILTLLSGIQID